MKYNYINNFQRDILIGFSEAEALFYSNPAKYWEEKAIELNKQIATLQSRLTEVIQDYHDAEQKVEFYRKETSKLRQYLNDNKIGKPNQGLFDALYDHIATLTSQLSEEKEKHGQTASDAIKWAMIELNDMGVFVFRNRKQQKEFEESISTYLKQFNQEK